MENKIKYPLGGKAFLSLPLFLTALIGGLSVAFADKADREQPINIEADQGEVDDKNQVATFSGNVVLTQGTLILRADSLEVRQSGGVFDVGIATGSPAYFKQKREGYEDYIEGEALKIEYESQSETLRMFKSAKLWRAGDLVTGDFISYDAQTEIFEVTGGEPTEKKRNRVKAIIQPKEQSNQ